MPKICIVDGCDNNQHVKVGYCSRHYYRYKTHGDPMGGRKGSSPGEPLNWIKDNSKYSGDECLKWPFDTSAYGYGVVKQDGKKRVASRVMCEVAHGLPPRGKIMDAAHSCGNGHLGCVNPKHLRWATRAENAADKKVHGTHREGEKTNFASITEAQAELIIKIAMSGSHTPQKEIADRVGVSVSIVGKILRGERWKFVAERMGYEPKAIKARGSQSGMSKLKESDILEIRALKGKIPNKDIAERFGVDPSHVSKIQKRVWWGWLDG